MVSLIQVRARRRGVALPGRVGGPAAPHTPPADPAGSNKHDEWVDAASSPPQRALLPPLCLFSRARSINHPAPIFFTCTQVFTLPDLAFTAVATRFTLPPRALAFSPDGATLAAAGDDEGIKLIDLSGGEGGGAPRVVRTLPASPYVRCLAWDPDGAFLASVTADGHVQVWDVGTGAVEASLRKAAARVDAGGHGRAGAAWSPDGALLAVGGPDGDVTLFERLAWAGAGTLCGGAPHAAAAASTAHPPPPPPPAWGALAFSPNGLYLLGGGRGGAAALWSLSASDGGGGGASGARPPLATAVLGGPVSALAWQGAVKSAGAGAATQAPPPPNEAAFLLDDGSVAVWAAPVPPGRPGPAADPDADGVAGGAPAPARGGVAAGGSVGGTTAMEEEEEEEEGGEDDGEGGGGRAAADPYRFSSLPPSRPAPHRRQPPIQPGSTVGSGRHRWLAYTMLGAISSRAPPSGVPGGGGGGPRVVEVDFHDASRAVTRGGGRVPILNDYFGFDLGALGPRGALYSAPPSPGAGCVVVFRPFAAWAGGGEWSAELPDGEAVVGLAAGSSFSAVATSARLLRLFSTAGLQTACVAVPGDIVAVAAQGGALAVAFHAHAPAHPADQGLGLALFDGCAGTSVGPASTPLPLSRRATLAWLGFSEEGLLAAYDSAGVMRVRPLGGLAAVGGSGAAAALATAPAAAGPAASDAASAHWTPVFDAAVARKGTEVFWPVGLAGDALHCVVCKAGALAEPGERPLVSLEPLHAPVLAVTGGGGGVGGVAGGADADAVLALEDGLLRGAASTAHWRAAVADAGAGLAPPPAAAAADEGLAAADAAADRALIRLFHAALKAGALERALEAASRLAGLKSLEGALKLANALRAPVLAERVAALLTRRLEMEALAAAAADAVEDTTAPTPGRGAVGSQATPAAAYSPATLLATAPSGDAVGVAPGAANPFLRAGRTPLAPAGRVGQAGNSMAAGADPSPAGDGGPAASMAAAKRSADMAALAAAAANPFARGAKAPRA